MHNATKTKRGFEQVGHAAIRGLVECWSANGDVARELTLCLVAVEPAAHAKAPGVVEDMPISGQAVHRDLCALSLLRAHYLVVCSRIEPAVDEGMDSYFLQLLDGVVDVLLGGHGSGQLGPDRLPVVPQIAAADAGCRFDCDTAGGRDGTNPLEPLIYSGWRDAELLRQGNLSSAADGSPDAGMDLGPLGSFVSHRLIVRNGLTDYQPTQAELPHGPTNGHHKAMLMGKELGVAVRAAIKLKGVRAKDVAAHFGVSPPSIQDWMNKGTIRKDRLPALWAYFSDVVGPEHWGLVEFPIPSRHPAELPDEISDEERRLLSNFRVLPEDEQRSYALEFETKGSLYRAYLERHLAKFHNPASVVEKTIATDRKNGSTDEHPGPANVPPAEQYGLDTLGKGAVSNERSADNVKARKRNNKRA